MCFLAVKYYNPLTQCTTFPRKLTNLLQVQTQCIQCKVRGQEKDDVLLLITLRFLIQ